MLAATIALRITDRRSKVTQWVISAKTVKLPGGGLGGLMALHYVAGSGEVQFCLGG